MSLFGPPNVERLKAKRDLKGLVKALGYQKDGSVPKQATEALAEIGVSAVEPLIAALTDKDSNVRGEVANVLEKLGWQPTNATERVLLAIARQNWEAATKEGATAVELLINVLTDNDKLVRQNAVATLGNLRDVRAVAPLINVLKYDRDLGEAAAAALVEIGDESAVEPLIHLVASYSDSSVRLAAANALGGIGTPAVVPLITLYEASNDPNVIMLSIMAWGTIGDVRAAKSISRGLLFSSNSIQEAATLALRKLGARAVEPLITALKDEQKQVAYQKAIALALGVIGDERAVEPLTALLTDGHPWVQEAAAVALSAIKELQQRLCIGLYVFNSTKISNEVSDSYGRYAEEELLKALSRALEPDGGWSALSSAVQACRGDIFEKSMTGGTPTTDFSAWLKNFIYDLDTTNLDAVAAREFESGKRLDYIPYVIGLAPLPRSYAMRADEQLLSRHTVGYIGLVRIYNAPSLREVATELGLPLRFEIKDSRCNGKLLASKEAIDEAGLEQEDPGAIGSLLSALNNSIWNMRQEAAEALGETGDARAVEPLIAALRDIAWPVRQSAAEALGRIGNPQAIEPLIAALRDNDERVRFIAADALEKIGDARAIEPLKQALQDNDPRVRESAGKALKKLSHQK